MNQHDRRYTQRAKQMVIAAQEQAAVHGASHVKPEYLLLALLQADPSVATKVLERMGVSAGRVEKNMEPHLLRRPALEESKVVTLDPRMKQVLDFSYDESRQSHTSYIGTEHLLLGIIREGDGIAFRTLAKLGVDIISARREVASYLGGGSEPPAARQQLRYEIRKYADPAAASRWLNDMTAQSFKLTFSSTSNGEMWIILEGLVPTLQAPKEPESAAPAEQESQSDTPEPADSDPAEPEGESL